MNTPIPDWAIEAASQGGGHGEHGIQELAQRIANAHAAANKRGKMHGSPADPSRLVKDLDVLDWNRQLRETNDKLRRALVGLVGVDTKEELDQMEGVMRLLPAPEADKVGMLNAIHALRDTL